MKRIVVMIVAMAVGFAAVAQESEHKGFAEGGYGLASFSYYNASLLNGGDGKYVNTPMIATRFGYKGWTLSLGANVLQTQVDSLNERGGRMMVMVGMDDRVDIGKHFEFSYAVELGLLMMSNRFSYRGKDYSFMRYGMTGLLSVGVNYKINEHLYGGLKVNILDVGAPLGEKPELPAGLLRNPRMDNSIFGYGLMFVIGTRF